MRISLGSKNHEKRYFRKHIFFSHLIFLPEWFLVLFSQNEKNKGLRKLKKKTLLSFFHEVPQIDSRKEGGIHMSLMVCRIDDGCG